MKMSCRINVQLGILLCAWNLVMMARAIDIDWGEYWRTNETCPFDDPFECYNEYYNDIDKCPQTNEFCKDPSDYDFVNWMSCQSYSDKFCGNLCSNVYDPMPTGSWYNRPYPGCFCMHVTPITIKLYNGIHKYTFTYTWTAYIEQGKWAESVQYTVPEIDCIEPDEPPYNLTIQHLCLDCTYRPPLMYTMSLIKDDDMTTYQNRTVSDLRLVKRPKRYHDYENCLDETYPLEKTPWYGEGKLQVSTPGKYSWYLGIENLWVHYTFRYNFTINSFCSSPPPSRSDMDVFMYKQIDGESFPTKWQKIYQTTDPYLNARCLEKGVKITVQAFPKENDGIYGTVSNVTFYLDLPNGSKYERTELQKPFLLYGDNVAASNWFGRRWFKGNHTLRIKARYQDGAIVDDTKYLMVQSVKDQC